MFVLLCVGRNQGTKCSQPKINFLLLKIDTLESSPLIFGREHTYLVRRWQFSRLAGWVKTFAKLQKLCEDSSFT
jgi:hypothetical protein